MRRALTIVALIAVPVVLGLFALLPRPAAGTAPPPPATVRGAYHIHSDRSDGSGSLDEIAAAAARAGLQFVIVTDHGDGTRPPDPPAYRHGVLTIDAVELNTSAGHYAVIGMGTAPYPLAGSAADVIEDVRRLGGFGVAAHPASPRPSLRWAAWDADIDGLEWINGDSEWRDEPGVPLLRAVLTYPFRAPEAMARLFDRQDGILQQWDALGATRRVVALAAADAHARLGFRQRTDPDRSLFHVPVPGYESIFRALSNHVVLDAPLSGNAGADAPRLIRAVADGRVYGVIDALGTPGSLSFTATSGRHAGAMGGDMAIDGDVLLRAQASAPPGTTLALIKNGQRVHEVTDGVLETNGGTDPAIYRIEAYTAGAPGGPPVPWILSNPIYAGLARPPRPVAVAREPVARIPARVDEAAVEHGARDTSSFERPSVADPRARRFAGDPPIAWSYALAAGAASGQFAAIAIPVSAGLSAFDRVRFTVTAPQPVRAWVQVRANGERWGATFYADTPARLVDLRLRSFLPIGPTSAESPPLDRVETLLFVVDTLNTLPGTSGAITIADGAFVR